MTAKARKHRDYQNKLPSVTSVLGMAPSFGLIHWFKKTPYDEILEKSGKGRKVGTEIHDCIQDHIEVNEVKIDTEYPELVTNALNSFMKFRAQHPEFTLEKAEIQMTSAKNKFNGTVDCVARMKLSPRDQEKFGIETELVILDWKTGEAKEYDIPAIYSDAHWQTSAYVHLWNENNEEQISRAFILAIAKDKVAYNLEEVTATEVKKSFKGYFKPLLKAFTYRKNNK